MPPSPCLELVLLLFAGGAFAAYENKFVIELGSRGGGGFAPRSAISGIERRELLRSPATTVESDSSPPPSIASAQSVGVSRDDSQLSANINEVKELVQNMDRVFNDRLDRLGERITRLEANQKSANWAMASASDWRPLVGHTGKKIRVFTALSSHEDAAAVCQAHGGELLNISTELENRRVTDYIQNYSQPRVYWLGVANAKSGFSFSAPAGRYHNFDEEAESERACAALTMVGKWMRQRCDEKNGFICQF